MTDEAQVPPTPPADAPPPPPAAPPPPPADPPAAGGSSGGSDNRAIMVVLSYLGPLALIPYLVEKEDPEVQWHAKHGLVLTAASIVLSLILFAISSATGCLGCLIQVPVTIAVIVVFVLCIVKGLNGERFTIPHLSELADRF